MKLIFSFTGLAQEKKDSLYQWICTMMVVLSIVNVELVVTIKAFEEMLEPNSDLNVLRQQCSTISKKIDWSMTTRIRKLDR